MKTLIIVVLILVTVAVLLGVVLALKKYGKQGSSATNGVKEWFTSYLWTILTVIGVIVVLSLAVWLLPSRSIEFLSPSPMTVWEFTGGYGFWFVVLVLIAYPATYLIKKEYEGSAKALRVVVALVGSVAFIGWLINGARSEKTPSQQVQAELPSLTMPPNGKSARISAPIGHAVTFSGSGFTTYCVYTDGTEGIVGDPVTPCRDGSMLYQYVRDTTGKPNAVTYKFIQTN